MRSRQHGAEFLTFVNIKDPKVGASLRASDGLIVLDFHWASNTRVIFTVIGAGYGNLGLAL